MLMNKWVFGLEYTVQITDKAKKKMVVLLSSE